MLSQVSKDIAAALPGSLVINAYLSESLPVQLAHVPRFLRYLLDQYRASSNGKLVVQVHDPGADKAADDAAASCEVEKLRIEVHGAYGATEIRSYYLGLCLEYGGHKVAIPQITQAQGVEYQISTLMKGLTQKKRKVAFTTGHGERDLDQGYKFLRKSIVRDLEYATVDPSKNAIGDDVDALVVGGPTQAFDERGRREIDAFLMKGKGALFLVDGMVMSSNALVSEPDAKKVSRPNNSGLDAILQRYGFKVNQDLVLDRQNVGGLVVGGGRNLLINSPVFVRVEIENAEHRRLRVLSHVSQLVFPFGSSVELVGPLAGGKAPPGAQLWTLARTSSTAWRETRAITFAATSGIEERPGVGPLDLAYAYEGPLLRSKRPVRLVLVGDSDFVADENLQLARMLPIYMEGGQFLFNAVDWITEDESLAPLRNKPVDDSRFSPAEN